MGHHIKNSAYCIITPTCILCGEYSKRGVYMDTGVLNTVLNTIITVLVIPLIPVVSAYIIAFLKKKTKELENSINSKVLNKYIDTAENAISTAVTSVAQTYTDSLKKKNGMLNPDEQKAAFEMAKLKTVRIIGDAGLEALKSAYSDIDTWLDNRIEYYVSQNKKQAT